MNRDALAEEYERVSFPRACGDEPIPINQLTDRHLFSPRLRG